MIEKTIYKTKDYSQFKLIEQNRKTNGSHIMNLVSSMKIKNLIQDMPILVDNNMRVIDGQHRLESCRLLGDDVYYTFASKANMHDIVNINNLTKKPLDIVRHQGVKHLFFNAVLF